MQPLVCRVNRRLWWIVPVGLVEGAFMFGGPWLSQSDSQHQAPVWAMGLLFWPVGALMVLGAAYLALELARGAIIADENGLRWRGAWGTWKSARWDEIRDYSLHGGPGGTPTIETLSGRLQLSRSYAGSEAIAAIVPARAVNAKAREWEVRGFRKAENWSQLLGLWTKPQRWTAPVMSANLLFLVAFGGGAVLFGPRNPHGRWMGLWFDWFAVVLAILTVGFLGAISVWGAILMWRERNFTWKHRAELLYLDARGAIWSGEGRRVVAKWDEVKNVERLPKAEGFERVRVETAQGDFEIWQLSSSDVWPKFRVRCETYAPDALENLRAQEANELDEELGAPQTREDGARIFSFRTRGNRLGLACASLALLFAPCFYLIGCYVHANDDAPFAPSWPLFWGALALAVVICGALWRWFACARIVADAGGLEFQAPFSRAWRVEWREVSGVGHDVWGDYLAAGGRKTYWRRVLATARREELELLMKRGATEKIIA